MDSPPPHPIYSLEAVDSSLKDKHIPDSDSKDYSVLKINFHSFCQEAFSEEIDEEIRTIILIAKVKNTFAI